MNIDSWEARLEIDSEKVEKIDIQ